MGFLLNYYLVSAPSALNSGHFRPWYKYTVWKKIPLVDKKNKTKVEFDTHYESLMKRIAGNIRRIRHSKGLTQEDLHSLGLERRWYQRIESGTYSVSLPTLDRVSRAFEVDISEFFKQI